MKASHDTIIAAFDLHHHRYAAGRLAWNVQYHVDCWKTAEEAFLGSSCQTFERLYEELRCKWQVFRGAGDHWSAQETFRNLTRLDAEVARKELSGSSLQDAEGIWRVLELMKGIKPTKSGPSIVAMSKFLHFWNPRLFVIVDNGVMWQKVFSHRWLWDEVTAMRKRVDALLPGGQTAHSDMVCDPGTYLAILLWAGEVIRFNPQITSCFVHYVSKHADDVKGLPLAQYEAAALEWFLLGLVELPPGGITVGHR